MIICKLRQDRGWSQEDLAAISGVSVRTIQRIEKGGRASLESLKCLAAVFETSIPNLREEQVLTDEKKSTLPEAVTELTGAPSESGGQSSGLSKEDRAALRYARYLKCYDDGYDEEGGWDAAGTLGKDLPEKERKVRKQVRKQVRELREFYQHAMAYAGVLVLLLLINLMVNPGTLWVLWVALGWGVGLGFHALDVFGQNLPFFGRDWGRDWERREVMKRLERVGRPASGR